MNSVISPLTGKANVQKIASLDIQRLISQYAGEYQLDVSRIFAKVGELSVYRCDQTGLKFYYPFELAGDGDFYAELSEHYKGYYNPWKWEHAKAAAFIHEGDEVLEIGCGNGYFLKEIQKKGAKTLGLDLNPQAIEKGRKLGVTITDQPIADHAATHTAAYDVVCAFQLFEHVNDVGQFLKDAIACLKTGGKLIIGVPNNDSAIFSKDPYHTLNLPPHHMLLWDKTSLASLADLFPLSITEIEAQPLNKTDKSIIYRLWLEKNLGKSTLSTFMHTFTRFVVKNLPLIQSEGATALAIYQKI